MLKYFTVTQDAAEELIRAQKLQNTDYQEARNFSDLLLGEDTDFSYIKTLIKVDLSNEGVVFFGLSENKWKNKNTLTFDLSTARFSNISSSERLMCLQKIVRFAIKYWRRLGLNSNEYTPPGSSKAIVFPFPIKTGSSYRVSIEREPDDRTQKRSPGQHLLVYRFGRDEGEGLSETVSVTYFRKAVAHLMDESIYNKKGAESSMGTRPLLVSDLKSAALGGYVDPADYLSYLTSPQHDFVTSSASTPSRIQGSAGTGKTLCLVLKSIYNLRESLSEDKPLRALFITPSDAITQSVKNTYDLYSYEGFHLNSKMVQTVDIKTLQEVCAKFIGHMIDEESFLDSDPQASKETQLLNIAVMFEELKLSLVKHKAMLSDEFYRFMLEEAELTIAELFRHEVSVVIKGRANFELEDYLKAARPVYGLPLKNQSDRHYVFKAYEKYTAQLDSLNQFDVDDVVITAISNLHTPIWRRQRQQEGYDCIFIDETHLFNMNELSLVHYLTKSTASNSISYAIDKSQALGDIGWSNDEVDTKIARNEQDKTQLKAVFRSKPDIVKLSYSILSHGVGLFSNFDNPIDYEAFWQESGDDKPKYMLVSEAELIKRSLAEADSIRSIEDVPKNTVAIGVFDRIMLEKVEAEFISAKKPYKILKKRGDFDSVKEAEKTSSYIIALVEYMGGLEFEGVVLVGVDKGRVPLEEGVGTSVSKIYNNYVAHNKMYVGVSRAKKKVSILGDLDRGVSPTLENALQAELIDIFN